MRFRDRPGMGSGALNRLLIGRTHLTHSFFVIKIQLLHANIVNVF